MAKRREKTMRPPQELLQDVSWTFAGSKFRSEAEFVEAVHQDEREYLAHIGQPGESHWQADEVVLRCHRVIVEHDYGDCDEDEVAELEADNPGGFTAGELLFKTHNAFVEILDGRDHHFFEGYMLIKQKNPNAVPRYEVWLGS